MSIQSKCFLCEYIPREAINAILNQLNLISKTVGASMGNLPVRSTISVHKVVKKEIGLRNVIHYYRENNTNNVLFFYLFLACVYVLS